MGVEGEGDVGCTVCVEGNLSSNCAQGLVIMTLEGWPSPSPKNYLGWAHPTDGGTDPHDSEMTKTQRKHWCKLVAQKVPSSSWCSPWSKRPVEVRGGLLGRGAVAVGWGVWRTLPPTHTIHPQTFSHPANKMPRNPLIIWHVQLQAHLKWN